MKNEDQVLALFAAENPIPSVDDLDLDVADISGHLVTYEQRRTEMIDLERKDETQDRTGQRRTLWLAAAAVVIVVAVGAILIGQGREPGPVASATTVVSTTTPTTTPTIDFVSLAVSAIDVWNAGDISAWKELWAPEQTSEDFIFSESEMKAGQKMELTGDCALVSSGANGAYVECPMFIDDDFHGTGNVRGSGTQTFAYGTDDGLLYDLSSDGFFEDENGNSYWQAFNEAFNTWLRLAHPDVFAEIGPQGSDPIWYLPGYATGNPDDMLIALDYVDEFVAQSDTYPLP